MNRRRIFTIDQFTMGIEYGILTIMNDGTGRIDDGFFDRKAIQ